MIAKTSRDNGAVIFMVQAEIAQLQFGFGLNVSLMVDVMGIITNFSGLWQEKKKPQATGLFAPGRFRPILDIIRLIGMASPNFLVHATG